ncbi:AraC family transcriptional regulator [Nocardioides sp. SR21]|uniref:AraC family transcriptional regulator n=1 Tax=Nocardioides sp. SR21 TaxID=2919501 RepID=UPI001FAA1AEC|nr:AraC family transcriptional regulator [Nocardioides sp. SR21]
MISDLTRLVDLVEERLTGDLEVAALARELGSTEDHLRRMFSAISGMPLSEYVRRRRMTVAASDLVATDDDLLTVAIRYGYGSTEAFGRAFRSVHGASPSDVRREGGPLRSQPILHFRLTVEGNDPMDTRIIEKPTFRLVGHAVRVPLVHEGVNPHIQQHVTSIAPEQHARLKALSDIEPAGLLSVSADVDPDRAEGSELTYLHGVAIGGAAPADLDVIEVPAGTWAVFRTHGPYPQALQQAWADAATRWFPANPWRWASGPEIVAVLDRADDFSTATTELWLPVEPAQSRP